MYIRKYSSENEYIVMCEKCNYAIPSSIRNNTPKIKNYIEGVGYIEDGREIVCERCGNVHNSETPIVKLDIPINNSPQCPVCKSYNITKISKTNKVGSVAVFGLLATGHVSKTFKCNSCGYKF